VTRVPLAAGVLAVLMIEVVVAAPLDTPATPMKRKKLSVRRKSKYQ